MTKLLYKPDWQKGKKTELKNDIMIRLSTGEYSIAKLSKEFKHFVKTNDPESGVDHQRVYNAMTSLRDFHRKNDGFVEQLDYFSYTAKKGRHGNIWGLTKNGIISLSKIQTPLEFFNMIFFMYDKNYHHSENNFSIKELITQYEIDRNLYRDKINSEIDLQIWNDIKKLLYSEKYYKNNYPILKSIAIKKQMSESEIIQYLKNLGRTEDEAYEQFQFCYNHGLIMDIEREHKFYLSIFGYLLLVSTFSIKKEYYEELFEKEFNTIMENYKFFFPKINHKDISHWDYIHIIKQIFLGHTSTENNELNLDVNRILAIHEYFEKVEQTKIRYLFQNFIYAYQNWCEKHNCHIFPYSSDFKMNSFHFIDMMTDDDFHENRDIIKGIIDENTHKIEFEIKDIHESILETTEGEKFEFIAITQDFKKFEKLMNQINKLFLKSLQKKPYELDEKSIDSVLLQLGFNQHKDIKNKILKTFENLHHLIKCKGILWELYQYGEKVEKINEFNIPTDQRMQHFYSFDHFNEDDNVKSMQDAIQFQFFTYLKSKDQKTQKKILKNSKVLQWYNEWINSLIEFHNKENDEIEIQKL